MKTFVRILVSIAIAFVTMYIFRLAGKSFLIAFLGGAIDMIVLNSIED